jgi:hypothetical protein
LPDGARLGSSGIGSSCRFWIRKYNAVSISRSAVSGGVAESEADRTEQEKTGSQAKHCSEAERKFGVIVGDRFQFILAEVSNHALPSVRADFGECVESCFYTASPTGGSAGFDPGPSLFSIESSSTGNGNTMVVFFSTPISVSVCR